MDAVNALSTMLGNNDNESADHLPTRLEQALANMVEKVIQKQKLGQVKAMVRNQATMEARDGTCLCDKRFLVCSAAVSAAVLTVAYVSTALRKLGCRNNNELDDEHFQAREALLTLFEP